MTEPSGLRVAAIMMIRDEGDIIEANIRHHLRLGVDHFVILDHGSADETADILRALTDEGLPLTVLTYGRDAEIELPHWYAALFAEVRARGADIVLQIDGDEFWHLTTGSFATLDWSEPVITAPRYNMFAPRAALGSQDSAPMTHVYRARRPFHPDEYRSRVLRGDREFTLDHSIHMVRLEPKVVFRLKDMGEIMIAGHGIISHSGQKLRPRPDGSATVFHYPLRSFEQYAKKVAAFGAVFERHPELDRSTSWQTRYLWELGGGDALERSFLDCFPDEADLRRLLDCGVLVRDTRMARALADGPGTLDGELDRLVATADSVVMDLIEEHSAEKRRAARMEAERQQAASERDGLAEERRRLADALSQATRDRDTLAAEQERLTAALAEASADRDVLTARCAALSAELEQIQRRSARRWPARLSAWLRRGGAA
ncbi:glycosyltransferase family 2 protein [Prosthecodimorpha staleyi]|uniref:Glycosyltransferase family 2 protein n=1 Tax=Prosthecodimorpha staleyi TaxID=2840188 RepID=A0A947DC44_9HYPH|nr:glycosyltransferase family 2 protein [Prosthecodimorpha staleyi]MBT9293227.1 glycosyltransferase family 2 protein [Prosthecodimorpha staleyi]